MAGTAATVPVAEAGAASPQRRGSHRAGGVLLVGVLAVAALWLSTVEGKRRLRQLLEAAISYVEAQGDAAMLFYLAFTVFGVICLVPTTLMEFSGGFLFASRYGLRTTWALTCLAKLVANVISVFLAKHFLRDWVRRNFVEKSELLSLVAEAVKEEPFKMAFLVRGSMAPISVKNYGLGVLDIGYLPIACASCVFAPFYALQNLYMGSACQSLQEVFAPRTASGESRSWAETAKAVLPIVFNVLLVLFLIKAVKVQLRKSKANIEAALRAKAERKAE